MSGAKDWAKLNIATLKVELADRNLDVTGKKVDLVTRLEQYECGRNSILMARFQIISLNILVMMSA